MINHSDIAIIGMSCRFPDANSTDAFWQNLCQAKESISFFSDEELLASGVHPALLTHPNYVKAGTVLPDYDSFDAFFFGLTPREAQTLDPQHRLFLECAWEAIESAGYRASGDTNQGPIGVYGGVGRNNYLLNNLYPNRELAILGAYQLILDNDKDFLSTRVSYKLNLTGPSINVQTACSTSLVAVHLACQSLLNGECDMALAGGVSMSIPQKSGYLYQEGMIASPDGHCRAFDASAQGTIGGNGVGIVMLKRCSEAVEDGDTIVAVIKGSAINNDGSLKVSYTSPGVDGQAQVIREAQAVAGIEPETITYIEAHGTGTVLGDPIEIAALTEAFQTQKKGYCAIGSVKTNIGHADTAAGVAGLIKAALALKHQLIPATLHFSKPNPKIDFANSPFYVNAELSEWKSHGIPRRAGVSSFGIGGTNAHLVLEEAPPREPSGDSRPWQLLVLSAKTLSALDAATTNLAVHLTAKHDKLADVAYTLAKGRARHPYRRMLVCQTVDEAINALPERASLPLGFHESGVRPIVFMFPGQGTQYVNMAADVYQFEATFREEVDACAEILKPILGFDLRDLLMPSQELTPAEATGQLEQTAITQPALFVIEYALAKLWLSWGVTPQAMIGHSIGEYVAATLSGVISLKDALTLVAIRGRLMQSLPKGAMLAVSLPKENLTRRLGEGHDHDYHDLSLAAVNGPSLCVVSGDVEAIEALQKSLTSQEVACRRLHTSHAFHSAIMEPILAPFTEQVRRVQLHPPEIPYISNVTGTWITEAEATNPTYWAKHLRQTVEFASGLEELLKEPDSILLEVGPGRTLSMFAKQQAKIKEQVVLRSLRHPREEQSDMAFLLTTLGQLWIAGGAIDWQGFYAHERRHRLPLPTYPFERQRYWIDPPKEDVVQSDMAPSRERSELIKKQEIADWFYRPSWERSFTPRTALFPRPALGGASPKGWSAGCCLLFVDECGLGYQLAKRLSEFGQDVITVRAGSGFTKLGDQTYVLDPGRRYEYDALVQELQRQGKNPQVIVHLWRVTSSSSQSTRRLTQGTALESTEAGLTLGFYSLLFLAQALGSTTEQIEITVVTNNMQEVTGEEVLCPEKATVLGPVKVIPQEYPNISCHSIDLVVEDDVIAESALINQLLAELNPSFSDFRLNDSANLPSQVIAYRGKYRWEQTFKPVRLHKRERSELLEANLIREGGVYLITGGLGGIGLALAEYLADFQSQLILIGRSAFPDREEWAEWLASDENNQVSHKIRQIQALEERGAQVLPISADVSNLVEMQAVVAKGLARFGQINGVIHSAGVAGGGIVLQKTRTEAAAVLAPKVRGTLVLEAVLEGIKLDFMILCSSLTSILAGFGQVDYTAANAFLDAFALQKSAQTHVISVNWDAWQEVGMAVNTALPRELQALRSESLKQAVLPAEGQKVFSRILSGQLPQVLVSTVDFGARFSQEDQEDQEDQEATFSPLAEAQISASYPRPELGHAYVAPRNETEQILAEIYQILLGVERVGIVDDFFGNRSLPPL